MRVHNRSMNYSAHAAHYRLMTNAGDVRTESRGGRDYLVAPVVLVKEGVLNGGYLPAEEIRKSVNGWNGQPVTVGHPQSGNEYVSANSPEIHDEYVIGSIFNAEYRERDRALVGEAWVDIALALERGDEARAVVERLAAFAQGDAGEDDLMDVSTGYFHQFNESQGSFQNERYHEEQYNILPDHLAILPNEEGACSIADGCGTPRVQTSGAEDTQENTRSVLEVHELLHGSVSGENEPAEPGADPTMDTKTKRLVENHGFDAENLPDEDSECFNRIFEAFVDEEDDEPTDGDDEQNEDEPEQNETAPATDGGEPLTKADLEAVKDELREELKAEQNAERAAGLRETITDNSDYSEDDLADWKPEQLEVLAEQVTRRESAGQPGVNYAGRGRGAEPVTNEDDDGWSDYEPPMVVHDAGTESDD